VYLDKQVDVDMDTSVSIVIHSVQVLEGEVISVLLPVNCRASYHTISTP